MNRFAAVIALSLIASCGDTPSEDGVDSTDGVSPRGTSMAIVIDVVDGDTFWVELDDSTKVKVRPIGYDTPESSECGFGEATDYLTGLVFGKQVELEPGVEPDRDKYGRLLRYVLVDGTDIGTAMIGAGFAIARYDGLDGYVEHPKQNAYRELDEQIPNVCP